MSTTRRSALAGALALAACNRPASSQAVAAEPAPLKDGAISRVGCTLMTAELDDPAFAALFARHFSQLTPEWEMKMEYICRDDGSLRWDAPDRIAAFARQNGMRLYGTTLVWYAETAKMFERLEGQKAAFGKAYRDYIQAVVGRYKGLAVGWDVVNEAVNEDGVGLREHIWSRNLGELDHMKLAFDHAAEADPGALLFVNEYFLEKIPRKRVEYMRMIERLLKSGAKLTGIGTQSHLDIDVKPGACREAIRDLASFGLPIHVSELDCSFSVERIDLRSEEDKLLVQAKLAEEVAQAYLDLPTNQRFAFTIWGLRDKDSWLKKEPNNSQDKPLMFDDNGQPKPMFDAVATALKA
ncbi:MAG: 1,4-beta-xylanase [Caulobacterales bacterium 68-7]|nr:MAG: 1,4-beta-xylanase [Caulobacterales bacterium 68-7]